jgi:hypothetical protein
MLAQLGRVPAEGEAVAWGGWRFEVIDMDGRRIDKVLVHRAMPRDEGSAAATPVRRGAPDGQPAGSSRSTRRAQ